MHIKKKKIHFLHDNKQMKEANKQTGEEDSVWRLDSQSCSVQPSVGTLDCIEGGSDFPKESWDPRFSCESTWLQNNSLPLLSEVVPSSGGQRQRPTQQPVVWGGL